jgi:hypothetical protein
MNPIKSVRCINSRMYYNYTHRTLQLFPCWCDPWVGWTQPTTRRRGAANPTGVIGAADHKGRLSCRRHYGSSIVQEHYFLEFERKRE